MWRVYKEAGRSWPVLSDDPVIDYMVMEAVFLKAQQQEQKAQEKAEREAWKKTKQRELLDQVNGGPIQ